MSQKFLTSIDLTLNQLLSALLENLASDPGTFTAGRAYYNTVSASVGFQLGAQARSVIIAFMTQEALADFRRVYGWKVGVDGSVALITVGIGGSIDTSKIATPIVGFIFDNKGLMYNLTLEGSKITRISR